MGCLDILAMRLGVSDRRIETALDVYTELVVWCIESFALISWFPKNWFVALFRCHEAPK